MQHRTRNWLSYFLLLGSGLAALLILTVPSTTIWGERHLPQEGSERIVLGSGHVIGQTFVWEEKQLDLVALWVDTTSGLPSEGRITLELRVNGESFTSVQALADVPSTGELLFPFESITAETGVAGEFLLSLVEPGQRIDLLYQIDGTKFEDGELLHPGTKQDTLT